MWPITQCLVTQESKMWLNWMVAGTVYDLNVFKGKTNLQKENSPHLQTVPENSKGWARASSTQCVDLRGVFIHEVSNLKISHVVMFYAIRYIHELSENMIYNVKQPHDRHCKTLSGSKLYQALKLSQVFLANTSYEQFWMSRLFVLFICP